MSLTDTLQTIDAGSAPADLLETALGLHAAGINVIRAKADGSKEPLGTDGGLWKQFHTIRSDRAQLRDWFAPGSAYGLGVVTGRISGNLEMFELEGRAIERLEELKTALAACDLGNLWQRLEDGLVERSPSGGVHWFYRVEGDAEPGATRLAYNAAGDLLAETKAHGGFVIMAPSGGSVHETGRPYERLAGDLENLPTITAEERDDLLLLTTRVLHNPASPKPAKAPRWWSGSDEAADLTNGQAWEYLTADSDAHQGVHSEYAPLVARIRPTGTDYDEMRAVTMRLADLSVRWRLPGGRSTYERIRAAWTSTPAPEWGKKSAADYRLAADALMKGAIEKKVAQITAEAEDAPIWHGRASAPMSEDDDVQVDEETAEVLETVTSAQEPVEALGRHAEPIAATPAPLVPQDAERERFESEVATEERRLAVQEEARARRARARMESVRRPPLRDYASFVAEPDPEESWLIEGLWPAEGNVLLVAPAKAGKSTTVGNLVRCIADGEPFLDRFATQQARVVLIDNEMGDTMLRKWLRDQHLAHPENLRVLSLRGAIHTFDIRDPEVRTYWAEQIRGADVLIFDCFMPLVGALGLSENDSSDVQSLLGAFDALKKEAGIDNGMIVHHAGHGDQARGRGSSALLGWPSVNWNITRLDEKDVASPRFLRAYGRDVDLEDQALTFDAATRRLSTTGTTRKETRQAEARSAREQKVAEAAALVRSWLRENNGAKKGDVEAAIGGSAGGRNLVREALAMLIDRGEVEERNAVNSRALHCYLVERGGETK